MAIFLDTGIFVAAYNTRDKYHKNAINILKDIVNGKYGNALTTDYIFDEAITLTLYKTKSLELTIRLGESILDSDIIELILVTIDDFENAWHIFKKLKRKLSFTDCTTLAIMKRLSIKHIASFDSDFDGLVGRIS